MHWDVGSTRKVSQHPLYMQRCIPPTHGDARRRDNSGDLETNFHGLQYRDLGSPSVGTFTGNGFSNASELGTAKGINIAGVSVVLVNLHILLLLGAPTGEDWTSCRTYDGIYARAERCYDVIG